MVRYARAKGSKGSNERTLEEPTPWLEMKEQLFKTEENICEKEENATTGQTANDATSWAEFHEFASKKNKRKECFNTDTSQEIHKKTKLMERKHEKILEKKSLDSNKSKISQPESHSQLPNKFQRKHKMTILEETQAGFPITRRKPANSNITMDDNGYSISTRLYDGFRVKEEDWERLTKMKKELIKKGILNSKIRDIIKLERRRAEAFLKRELKKVCFQCRRPGHIISECPELNSPKLFSRKHVIPNSKKSGICYKCGSSEHSHLDCTVVQSDDYKFASCFVCGEEGHISRQCPDNPCGMYPKGGACRVCGDVTHLKRDCPVYQKVQQETAITLPTIKNTQVEALEDETTQVHVAPKIHKKKLVVFNKK